MESNNIVIDSSIWIALVLEQDSQHRKAVDFFENCTDKNIVIPQDILKETATVLKNRQDGYIAQHFIDFVSDNNDISILSDSPYFSRTLDRHKELVHTNLSCIDIELVVYSEQYPVYTFDQELAQHLRKH